MLAAFALMEAVAWFTHKYIMHGVLWVLHKSHHSERTGWFEWNDLFGIFFALLAMVLIRVGFKELNYFFWTGLGMTLYGFSYFIFHDILVHRRVKMKYGAKNNYLKGIIRAHKIHHKTTQKENGKAFGFLFTIKKYRDS